MFFRLLLLFIVVPLIELALLIWLGKETEIWVPIGLVLLTGFVGASLMRWQGREAYRHIVEELSIGNLPADALLDGLLVFTGGIVLVTPGMLTDLFGICLLLPVIRGFIRFKVKAWLKRKIAAGQVTFVSNFHDRFGSGPFES